MVNNNTTQFILDIGTIDKRRYGDMDLDSLALYGLHYLKENNIPLFFEFIAIALFKLFPERFSMENFNQFPDTNRISKALRRLTDEKRKSWATGNIENGFTITEFGYEAAEQIAERLKRKVGTILERRQRVTRTRGRSSRDMIKEIRNSELFKKWTSKPSQPTVFEVTAFMNAAPYTPKNLLLKHLEQMNGAAKEEDDRNVINFLAWLKDLIK